MGVYGWGLALGSIRKEKDASKGQGILGRTLRSDPNWGSLYVVLKTWRPLFGAPILRMIVLYSIWGYISGPLFLETPI